MALRIQLGWRHQSRSTDDYTYYLEQDEKTAEFFLVTERCGLGDDHNVSRTSLTKAQEHRFYGAAMKLIKERLFGE